MALTGTFTFLLTDVAGSTALWQEDPATMGDAVARLDALIAAEVSEHGGKLVKSKGEGDSAFAVFAKATDAVACAGAIQRALQLREADGPRLRVRMALHTGEAAVRDGDYFGRTVNRGARLRSCAHGGQVVLSQTTFELVRDALPPDVSVKDLGPHRLKDLDRPERVFQLCHPDLQEDFPALASLNAGQHNLPVQHTSLIGREEELEALRTLVLERGARLVTLTGPGGIGKTRLALQAAAEVVDEFGGGAWWVPLAAVNDGALVLPAIAAAMRLSPREDVAAFLHERRVLLLLDNLEQVPEAAKPVADLLQHCRGLSVLATSRQPLRVHGEQTFDVSPLPMPAKGVEADVATASSFDSVRLFVERARSAKLDFELTARNAVPVAEICRALDGLPLAIELAAARIRLLPPQSMLGRLGNRLALLTRGQKDLPARHQTLRDTIAWSYELLEPDDQTWFRKLGVFVGGCTLDAAEAVCGDDASDVLERLSSLLDQSLLRVDDEHPDESRFDMLETVREFALEALEDNGEAGDVRARHRDWFVALAVQAEPRLVGPDQALWLERLEREHDNLRAVLDWCVGSEPETALRLAAALARFWNVRGHFTEGRMRLERTIEAVGERSPLRTKAVATLGALARLQGDNPAARTLLEEALETAREIGARRVVADSLAQLGYIAVSEADLAAASELHGESLAIRRDLGDEPGIATALGNLGELALARADYREARALTQEALGILRRLGADKVRIAAALTNFGAALHKLGDWRERDRCWEESLALGREVGDKWGVARALGNLAIASFERGDYPEANARLEQSLAMCRELDDRRGVAQGLSVLGAVARAERDLSAARRLFRESMALQQELGERYLHPTLLTQLAEVAHYEDDRRRALGLYEEALTVARGLGDRPAEAIALAALGELALDEDATGTAADRYEEALLAAEEQGDVRLIARCLSGLGAVALARGDSDAAAGRYDEALSIVRELGNIEALAECLRGIVDVLAVSGRGEGAANLLGAARSLVGDRLAPREERQRDERLANLSGLLGAEVLEAELQHGREAGWEAALRRERSSVPHNLIRLEGDTFNITFNGTPVSLPDVLGLRYLAVLLTHPGREIHCAELAGGPRSVKGGEAGLTVAGLGHSGEILDADARLAYRRRLDELQAAVEEARAAADHVAEERSLAEIAAMAAELRTAVGLGGRARRGNDESERMRKAVTKCLRQALDKIQGVHPELWLHLSKSLRTGTFCVYTPEPPSAWGT